MIVLGVDTCGAEGSLALARLAPAGPVLIPAEPVLIEEVALTGPRYAGVLIPELRALLARHELAAVGLAALVVVRGPGSFTGIRMGLSMVKALSEATQVPVVALSRLRVLAHAHQSSGAVLDAGRGEFYFLDDTGEWLLTRDEVLERLSPGSDAVVAEAPVAAALPLARVVPLPRASDAVLLAQTRLAERDYDDPSLLDGNYVRSPGYRPGHRSAGS